MDTALIKLYAADDPDQLVKYAQTEDLICDFDECKACLIKNGRHHALALLQQKHGQLDNALSTWSSLLANKIEDPQFPGLEFFVSSLLQ